MSPREFNSYTASTRPGVEKLLKRAIKRHPRFFVAIATGVPVLLGLALWHYWILYSDLTGARDDLLSVQSRLSDVGLNLTSADLAVADERTRDAEARLKGAKTQLRYDPILRLARYLPGTGSQVRAVEDYVYMGELLAQIGGEATTAGQKAVNLRENPPQVEPLTAAVIQLLDDTQPSLARINTLTNELVQIRLGMGDEKLLPPLASARARLDKELPKLANEVEQAVMMQQLLPGLLGFHGERNYLVLALNNGELLPGGGLVTAAGVLPISDGVNKPVQFTDSTSWGDAWKALGGGYIEPPGPLKRYLLKDFTWNLLVSDWNPDFPTWSQQAVDFYQLVHGKQPLDGVVAVDLVTLQRLLAITGPKELLVEGHGYVTFDSNNAVLELEQLTRQPFEPGSDRKSVIGDLAQAILADLLHLPSGKWAQAIETVRSLGREGHVQVLSYNADEQTLVRDVGWDGRLRDVAGDYLEFNEASVNSTKLNLIIKPEGSLRVDINKLGDARHELVLQYTNPLPEWAKGKDPKLVQQLMLGGLYGGYLRVFGSKGTTGFAAERNGSPIGIEDVGEEGGKPWFGVFMPLPSGQQAEMRFQWSTTMATTAQGANSYSLYIQKQPGTEGMCLALSVFRAGKPPKSLKIDGGSRDAQGRICITSDVTVTASF